MTTTLLLIDVQNSFHPGGSLAIATANEDAERIATLIKTEAAKLSRIVVTLDSHHKLHIAHAGFWVSSTTGAHPDAFTTITNQDVQDKKWVPRDNVDLGTEHQIDPAIFNGTDQVLNADGSVDLYKYALEYTKRLEAQGRFQLIIWPEHCLISSPGNNVVPCIQTAMQEWALSTGRSVEFVNKGEHNLTEMYSAIKAEIPVSGSTSTNQPLVDSLCSTDALLVGGQAKSHCVNYTLRDILDNKPAAYLNSSVTLLVDCTSPVAGYEADADKFVDDMKKAGVNVKKSTELNL